MLKYLCAAGAGNGRLERAGVSDYEMMGAAYVKPRVDCSVIDKGKRAVHGNAFVPKDALGADCRARVHVLGQIAGGRRCFVYCNYCQDYEKAK